MKTLGLVAVAAVAVVLATAPPSYASHGAGHSQHGFSGGRSGGHFEGRHFDRHRHARGVIIGSPFFWGAPYYWNYGPAYPPPPPSYWYYCPSYGAYYPSVGTCPEAWVPVPTSR